MHPASSSVKGGAGVGGTISQMTQRIAPSNSTQVLTGRVRIPSQVYLLPSRSFSGYRTVSNKGNLKTKPLSSIFCQELWFKAFRNLTWVIGKWQNTWKEIFLKKGKLHQYCKSIRVPDESYSKISSKSISVVRYWKSLLALKCSVPNKEIWLQPHALGKSTYSERIQSPKEHFKAS